MIDIVKTYKAGTVPVTILRGAGGFEKGLVEVAAAAVFAASVVINAALGNLFIITATTNAAFTIALPTNPSIGQEISIMLVNTSGGALGAITTPAGYHLVAAFPSPADTKNQTVTLRCISAGVWREVSRTGGDVAN